jgi:hypothetical protein
MGYLQKMLSFIQLMDNLPNIGFEAVCILKIEKLK